MRTTRTIFHQQRTSRYGKSSQSQQQKLSQSFFNSIKQYNTIDATKPKINPQTDDEKIISLTQKNQRLKLQISKIQSVFSHYKEEDNKPFKAEYGIKLPEIRNQVIDKELQNANKQIKLYEVQIQKLKKSQEQGTFGNRLTAIQRILRQKQQMKENLKAQLERLQKSSSKLTKSLTDNRSKIWQQQRLRKLNDELKIYEKKWFQQQKKRVVFQEVQKKKTQHGAKLQKELLAVGVSEGVIEELRRQVFEQSSVGKIKQNNQQKESAQIRSPDSYKSLINQLKLLKKVTVTNQKLFQKLSIEKNDFMEKNKQVLDKLGQTQREIDSIELQLGQMKKNIDPQKLKPLIKQSPIFTSRLTTNSISTSFDDISIDPLGSKSKTLLQHHFEFVEIGVVNKRSEKFNDRRVLGKKSAKIVAVEFYQNRMQLLGFKFTYQLQEGERLVGTLMQMKNDNERHLQRKQFTLGQNDYFTSVECFINQKSIIIGIILISQSGQIAKAGNFQTQKQYLQLSLKQYPACVYSCISKQGIQLLGVQKVEPQSF